MTCFHLKIDWNFIFLYVNITKDGKNSQQKISRKSKGTAKELNTGSDIPLARF